MVFGYWFDFCNEPRLQYEWVKRDPSLKIAVREQSAAFFNGVKLQKTGWVKISGRNVRCAAFSPPEEMDNESCWSMEIEDVVLLVWNAPKREILYTKRGAYTPQQLQYWIYHTFFPMILELGRQQNILHVGSVEVEGKPVLFSAFSFGGKSTLTDYFLKQGHRLLSDDSLGIEKREDGYYAIPSYPFHRPFRQLETLGYYTENFSTTPKPVHAVYRLKKVAPNTAVSISELKGIEKFKAFHYSVFVNFDFMKQERFVFFTKMAKAVPVYQLQIPWDKARLPEVYEQIVQHSRMVAGQETADVISEC